ncbi:acyl carrier protein [Maridesulfovibrio sp.]|uniref:acyl carrier protein n=1 Tax=Maridesulfovibrio sp. TaxID=2795000 RepID=UPI0029CA43F5|nr:acyl carrier protein [Maridesulfovibrio sp.]
MSVTVANVIELFASAVPPETLDKIDPDTPLLTQGVDSLALTTLAVALQREFSIELTIADTIALRTVNDIVNFINAKGK